MSRSKWWTAACATLAVMLTVGCGSGSVTVTGQDVDVSALNDLGESLRMYQVAKKKPPQSLAELTKMENIGGNGIAAAKMGEIVVEWGAALPDTNEEPGSSTSAEVLAYGKNVPKEGGHVLMLDRTIKKMTAEEFNAAPKPAKAAKK